MGSANTDFYTFETEISFYFVNKFLDGCPEHFGHLRNVVTTNLEILLSTVVGTLFVTTIHHTTLSTTRTPLKLLLVFHIFL